jgi:hypothetical protein
LGATSRVARLSRLSRRVWAMKAYAQYAHRKKVVHSITTPT